MKLEDLNKLNDTIGRIDRYMNVENHIIKESLDESITDYSVTSIYPELKELRERLVNKYNEMRMEVFKN